MQWKGPLSFRQIHDEIPRFQLRSQDPKIGSEIPRSWVTKVDGKGDGAGKKVGGKGDGAVANVAKAGPTKIHLT